MSCSYLSYRWKAANGKNPTNIISCNHITGKCHLDFIFLRFDAIFELHLNRSDDISDPKVAILAFLSSCRSTTWSIGGRSLEMKERKWRETRIKPLPDLGFRFLLQLLPSFGRGFFGKGKEKAWVWRRPQGRRGRVSCTHSSGKVKRQVHRGISTDLCSRVLTRDPTFRAHNVVLVEK